MTVLKISELKLGDVVKLFDGPFGTAIVSKYDGENVTFFRPYGHHENFSYTGGVLCYVGIEEFSRPVTDKSTVEVFQRTDLK